MSRPPPMRFLTRHDPRADNSIELLEIAKRLATEVFEVDGEIPATFLFDNPPGNFTSALQWGWSNDDEKHRIAYTIHQMCVQLDLPRYAVVIEMYFSTFKASPGTSMEEVQKRMPRPRDDPNRRECILIAVHSLRGEPTVTALYVIERPESGKPRLVLDSKMSGMEFVDMTFAPPTTKH